MKSPSSPREYATHKPVGASYAITYLKTSRREGKCEDVVTYMQHNVQAWNTIITQYHSHNHKLRSTKPTASHQITQQRQEQISDSGPGCRLGMSSVSSKDCLLFFPAILLILVYFSSLTAYFPHFMLVVYCKKIRYIGQYSEYTHYKTPHTKGPKPDGWLLMKHET